jgi:diguanylate cyclase (GGDEF)-like protein/PAS domain S-box-containing protein
VQIAEQVYRQDASYVFGADLRANLLQEVIRRSEDKTDGQAPVPLIYHDQGDIAHIFIGMPVMFGGNLQGIVAAQLEINLLETIPTTQVIRSMVLEDNYSSKQDHSHLDEQGVQKESVEHFSVPGFELTLAMEPDWDVLRTAGTTLVRNTALALSLALGAPFVLLSVLGHQTIVRPHLKLEKQKKALAELAAVAEKANDAIMVTDLSGRIEWVNRAFEKLSGYLAKDVHGRRPGDFLQGPETDGQARAKISQGLKQRAPVQIDIVNYKRDGQAYWISLSISPLLDEQERPYGFVAISNDITERRRRETELAEAKARIEHQANHDALTGLPNRRAFDKILSARAAASDRLEATVVRIDLDHFKYVNDTHGHAAGDAVLVNVAEILRDETKSTKIAARVGGDEFVILMGRGYYTESARQMAERMLRRIQRPLPYGNSTLSVGASFGIASTEQGLVPFEDVVVSADAALYEAKEAGRNAVHLYTPELHAHATEHRHIASRLHGAIAQAEFVPFYQPQIDARDGSLIGLEVLSRWPQSNGEVLSPDLYLPVAEKIGLLTEVDSALFRRTASEIGAINAVALKVPIVSFNVTAPRLADPDVQNAALALSREANFQIAFEILETMLIDDKGTEIDFHLDRLREAGIRLHVDDFGTGHASIVGLTSARPDCLKIDQQLVRPLTEGGCSWSMVSAIVDIARALQIDIIAEGVETARHAEILLSLGVYAQQGFFYARPMPASELHDFLEEPGKVKRA